jgi:hypothetical protein
MQGERLEVGIINAFFLDHPGGTVEWRALEVLR